MVAEPGAGSTAELGEIRAALEAMNVRVNTQDNTMLMLRSELQQLKESMRADIIKETEKATKMVTMAALEKMKEEKEQDQDRKKRIKGYDSKNMLQPGTYDGKPETFQSWHELFVAQLAALSEEWDALLMAARKCGDEPISPGKVEEMMTDLELDIGQIPNINRTLYVSLLKFTSNDAHGKVVSSGIEQALDTYRYLYLKGKNDTTMNVMRIKTRVMHPDVANTVEEVESKMNKWKEDIRYLKETDNYNMNDDQLKTIAVSMLPEELADHMIRKFSDLKTFEELEKEVMNVVNRSEMKKGSKKKGLNVVADATQEENDQQAFVWNDQIGGYLCMTVPSHKRPRSDEGPNHDKDANMNDPTGVKKGPATGCWICGGDHYASKCPQAEGKGGQKGAKGGKGGKGDKGKGKGWVTAREWSSYYPGPTMQTWNSWYPKGQGKGGFKGGYKGGGKGIKGLTDYTMTADGQQLTFPPLGNLNGDGWNECSHQWNEDGQSGNWPIGQVVKMTTDLKETGESGYKSVQSKRKYSKTNEFDESLHRAISKRTQTKNRFSALQTIQERIEEDQDIGKGSSPFSSSSNLGPTADARDKEKNDRNKSIDEFFAALRENAITQEEERQQRIREYRITEAAKAGLQQHMTNMKLNADMNLLTKIPEASIRNCTALKTNGWTRMSMAVDSGACDNVADPDQLPCFVMETEASRAGANFASATGEPIPNMGEMIVPMLTREGSLRSMRIQAAPVTKPLASVMKIVKAGHLVVFDEKGSYIMNKTTGETNMLREEDGNYMLDVWVKPTNEADAKSAFGRQP